MIKSITKTFFILFAFVAFGISSSFAQKTTLLSSEQSNNTVTVQKKAELHPNQLSHPQAVDTKLSTKADKKLESAPAKKAMSTEDRAKSLNASMAEPKPSKTAVIEKPKQKKALSIEDAVRKLKEDQ